MKTVDFTEITIQEYLQDPGVHAPPEIERYLYGQCHMFAIALNRLSGLPIMVITEPRFTSTEGVYITGLVHAMCFKEGDVSRVFDAKGWRSIKDIEDSYYVHPDCTWRVVTAMGCEEIVSAIVPLEEEFFEQTLEFIKKHGYLEKINA